MIKSTTYGVLLKLNDTLVYEGMLIDAKSIANIKTSSKLYEDESAQINATMLRQATIGEDGELFKDYQPVQAINQQCHSIELMTDTDWKSINIILASNLQQIQYLPYIVKYGNFNGKVLTTQPVSQLGKKVAEANAKYLRNHYKPIESEDIDNCWKQVIALSYGQIYTYSPETAFTAYSSAHSLGSANWFIRFGMEHLYLMSATSIINYRYPQEFQSHILSTVRRVVITKTLIEKNEYEQHLLDMTKLLNDSVSKSYQSMCMLVISSWQLLDILDVLIRKFYENTKIYLVCSEAKGIVQLSNGNSEYLKLRLCDKVLEGKEPFEFKAIINAKKLFLFECWEDALRHMNESKDKNILFVATHPSLKIGDSIKIWEYLNSVHPSLNSVVSIDTFYTLDDISKNVTNNKVKVISISLDPSMCFTELQSLEAFNSQTFFINSEYSTNLKGVEYNSKEFTSLCMDINSLPLTFRQHYHDIDEPTKALVSIEDNTIVATTIKPTTLKEALMLHQIESQRKASILVNKEQIQDKIACFMKKLKEIGFEAGEFLEIDDKFQLSIKNVKTGITTILTMQTAQPPSINLKSEELIDMKSIRMLLFSTLKIT